MYGIELTLNHPKNKNVKFAIMSSVKKFRRRSSAQFIYINDCKLFIQVAYTTLSTTEAEFMQELQDKKMSIACIIPPGSNVEANNVVDAVFDIDLSKQPSYKKMQDLLRYIIQVGNSED